MWCAGSRDLESVGSSKLAQSEATFRIHAALSPVSLAVQVRQQCSCHSIFAMFVLRASSQSLSSEHLCNAQRHSIFAMFCVLCSGCNAVAGSTLTALLTVTMQMICMVQRGIIAAHSTQDSITAVAAASHLLLVGRSSGDVVSYTLPDLAPAGNTILQQLAPYSQLS